MKSSNGKNNGTNGMYKVGSIKCTKPPKIKNMAIVNFSITHIRSFINLFILNIVIYFFPIITIPSTTEIMKKLKKKITRNIRRVFVVNKIRYEIIKINPTYNNLFKLINIFIVSTIWISEV